MKSNAYFLGFTFLGLLMVGCAKKAENVAAAYVTPTTYQNYTCAQIAEEAQRLSAHAAELSGAQNSKRTGDVVKTTVGIVIFWPTLLFLSGDDETTAQLSRIKGEMDAIEQASIRKHCGIRFESQMARR